MLLVDTNAMKNTVHCYHKFVNEAYNQSSTILSSKSALDQIENIFNPFYAS